jgi:hypothetical protein
MARTRGQDQVQGLRLFHQGGTTQEFIFVLVSASVSVVQFCYSLKKVLAPFGTMAPQVSTVGYRMLRRRTKTVQEIR